MRQLRIVLLVMATALLGVEARAGHYSDFYVLPAAAHTPGANDTFWRSDVAIHNFQSTPLSVELAVIESGEGNYDNVFPVVPSGGMTSVTVPPAGSVLLEDVLRGHRGLGSVTGAILIGADQPFAVTSRAYNMTAGGATVGQTVPPVDTFLENTFGRTELANAVAYVPGIINNDRFRSNLGAVIGNGNATGEPLTVAVTVRNAAGAVVGTRQISVVAGAFTHLQFAVATMAGSQLIDIGSAEFRIVGGSGALVPYASVVDNATGDAVFIAGRLPPNAPATGTAAANKAGHTSLFRLLLDGVIESHRKVPGEPFRWHRAR